jgi:hypothetical protein
MAQLGHNAPPWRVSREKSAEPAVLHFAAKSLEMPPAPSRVATSADAHTL